MHRLRRQAYPVAWSSDRAPAKQQSGIEGSYSRGFAHQGKVAFHGAPEAGLVLLRSHDCRGFPFRSSP
jgi:hypothetical protein